MSTNKIIFISGPTAVGKSEVALEVAKQLNGEIVSCDSMQVYREINIASNKPTALERKQVEYHLLDVASVYEEFDVNQYVKLANEVIEDILMRNKIPVVCGGTGMYMEGLIEGIFEGPKADWDLRSRLEAESLESLHERLKEVDPESGAKIHLNDLRRIIRALEVFELTGKPISEWQKERTGLADKYSVKSFVLTCDRDNLYDRINRRVEKMVENGLMEEMQKLDINNISRTASQLIGVKEVVSFLRDEIDFKRCTELIKQNSRHYAKRQLTWYRKDERNKWIDWDVCNPINEIIKSVIDE